MGIVASKGLSPWFKRPGGGVKNNYTPILIAALFKNSPGGVFMG